jgi:hypothetical protein
MLIRSVNPYDFGSMMEELFSPIKYNRALENVGTKDKPTIVTRGEWVEKKYRAWREEDGSYHEELIEEEGEK